MVPPVAFPTPPIASAIRTRLTTSHRVSDTICTWVGGAPTRDRIAKLTSRSPPPPSLVGGGSTVAGSMEKMTSPTLVDTSNSPLNAE